MSNEVLERIGSEIEKCFSLKKLPLKLIEDLLAQRQEAIDLACSEGWRPSRRVIRQDKRLLVLVAALRDQFQRQLEAKSKTNLRREAESSTSRFFDQKC